MNANEEQTLPGGSRIVRVPRCADARGSLSFAEAERHIPFAVNRVFWIYGVPEGARRGGHAHRTCAEVVFPVAGGFTMVVDDGRQRAEVCLTDPSEGILVPAGVWCELRDFQPGTVLVCMASQAYDAAGYVHDYSQFQRQACFVSHQ